MNKIDAVIQENLKAKDEKILWHYHRKPRLLWVIVMVLWIPLAITAFFFLLHKKGGWLGMTSLLLIFLGLSLFYRLAQSETYVITNYRLFILRAKRIVKEVKLEKIKSIKLWYKKKKYYITLEQEGYSAPLVLRRIDGLDRSSFIHLHNLIKSSGKLKEQNSVDKRR